MNVRVHVRFVRGDRYIVVRSVPNKRHVGQETHIRAMRNSASRSERESRIVSLPRNVKQEAR